MPKEYINHPEPERVSYALTKDELDRGEDAIDVLPAGPQIGLHWHAGEDTVQLSFSMDADVLSRIVATRNYELPDHAFVTEPGRAVFYSEALNRHELQRLVKTARRARDAAYGADE